MSLQTGGSWPDGVVKWSLNSRLIVRACDPNGSPIYTYAPNHLLDFTMLEPGGTLDGPVPTRCGPIDLSEMEYIDRVRFNRRKEPLKLGVYKRLPVEWIATDKVITGDPDPTYYRVGLETVLSYGNHERNYFQVRLYPGPWRDCWMPLYRRENLQDHNVGIKVQVVFEQMDLSSALPYVGDTQPYGTVDWQGW